MNKPMSAKDARLNQAVEEWRAGQAPADFVELVTEWADSLTGYCRKHNAALLSDDELPGASMVWTLERLTDWRVGEGTASGWLASGFRAFLSEYVRERMGQPSKTWTRVLAAAAAVRQEAQVPLSMPDWQARTRTRILDQYCARVREAHPDWAIERATFEARAMARKDGMLAALDAFPEIVAVDGAPMRLDQPVGEDSMTFGETLEAREVHGDSNVEVLVSLMLGDDAPWARAALAAGDAQPSGTRASKGLLAELAEESGHTAEDLQTVLKLAKPRARAPHAQWAYLSRTPVVTRARVADMFADA